MKCGLFTLFHIGRVLWLLVLSVSSTARGLGVVTSSSIKSISVSSIRSTTLGLDPPTVNRLNGESFQQDALATFNGMFDPLMEDYLNRHLIPS